MGKTSAFYTEEQRRAWAQSMLPDLERRKKSVAEGEVVIYVAEIEKRIIGFCAASFQKSLLLSLYVEPGPWKGVGKRLLLTVEEKAVQTGVFFLEGSTSYNAKDFYRQCGYEIGEACVHNLPNGLAISCYKICKTLNCSI